MADETESDIGSGEEESIWDEPELLFVYGGIIAVIILVTPFLKKIPRSRGKNVNNQIVFIVTYIACLLLLPDILKDALCAPFGVLAVGTIMPIYESIYAACSVGEEDDSMWLQFWIVNAVFTYCTEFMDNISEAYPTVGEHWYEFEFFFTLWLILPQTDGASLIYDVFTEPFIAPICKKGKTKMEGWGAVIMAATNTSYLWIVWYAFMILPEQARRFVVVAVGTVYPVAASTVALTTATGLDDTYWLVYWSCFSVLFICMDYLETFLGSIRGFYSLCLCATVYLMLPMFEGAKAVFRNVLVPLSGQYENMLLHDAYLVRLETEGKIPQQYHKKVFSKMANVFTEGKKE